MKKEQLLGISKSQIKWKTNYQYVNDYFIKNGDTMIPRDYVVNGYQISRWLDYQKQRNKGVGKPLSETEINLLEQINIIWDTLDDKWINMYQLAKNYQKSYHHLNVPRDYEIDGKKLGNWINYQRALYNKGVLSKEKETLLTNIDMIWNLEKYNFIHKKIDNRTKKAIKIQLLKQLEDVLLQDIELEEIEKQFVKKLSL